MRECWNVKCVFWAPLPDRTRWVLLCLVKLKLYSVVWVSLIEMQLDCSRAFIAKVKFCMSSFLVFSLKLLPAVLGIETEAFACPGPPQMMRWYKEAPVPVRGLYHWAHLKLWPLGAPDCPGSQKQRTEVKHTHFILLCVLTETVFIKCDTLVIYTDHEVYFSFAFVLYISIALAQ